MERVFGDVFQAYVRYLDTVGAVADGASVDRVGTFDQWLGGAGRSFGLAVIDCYAPGSVASGRATLESAQVLGSFGKSGARVVGADVASVDFESDCLDAFKSQEVGDGSCFVERRFDSVECVADAEDLKIRGKNYNRNKKKRAARRELARRGEKGEFRNENVDEGVCDGDEAKGFRFDGQRAALRRSLEEKWQAENELKVAKAKRELELLKSEDLDAVKKLRERKVQGATERTMVQIEKAHASLVQTGNVPGVQPVQQGFCQTVVDGEVVESVPGLSGGESKGCSISPSSSISEREVREMKKELEDLKLENQKLRRKQKRMPLAFEVMQSQEAVPVSVVNGSIPESAREALDEVIGNGEWTYEGELDMDPDTLYLRKEFFGFS